MKKKINRLYVLAIAALVALAVPHAAQAKWSKASTSFEYDGVRVKVIDRHEFVGHLMDTYGYAIYKNNNEEPVTVNWRSYGVLQNSGKLVMLDDKSFSLQAGQEMSQVYSYGAGRFSHQSFTKYLIAIEVKKKATTPAPPVAPVTPPAAAKQVTDSNADSVYARLSQLKSQNKFTQDDYSQAIDWLRYTFDKKLLSMYRQTVALIQHDKDEEARQLRASMGQLGQSWEELADYITKADDEGRLDAATKAKFHDLKSHVEDELADL